MNLSPALEAMLIYMLPQAYYLYLTQDKLVIYEVCIWQKVKYSVRKAWYVKPYTNNQIFQKFFFMKLAKNVQQKLQR